MRMFHRISPLSMKNAVAPALFFFLSSAVSAGDCVVLLHGLNRTSASMQQLQTALENEKFSVANIDYPSREQSIEALAKTAVASGIDRCQEQSADAIHFVTHSLGGILVRQYFQTNDLDQLGRVVMLGPPNAGSEAVDKLKNLPVFELLNGPAGEQLGTAATALPAQLGPVDFELGIIAGSQSINLILSSLIPGQDDGKVSVENTKVEGMTGFVTLPVTHPFMMSNSSVIEETIHFLSHGKFSAKSENNPPASAE